MECKEINNFNHKDNSIIKIYYQLDNIEIYILIQNNFNKILCF